MDLFLSYGFFHALQVFLIFFLQAPTLPPGGWCINSLTNGLGKVFDLSISSLGYKSGLDIMITCSTLTLEHVTCRFSFSVVGSMYGLLIG